jgi:hypothetical protein
VTKGSAAACQFASLAGFYNILFSHQQEQFLYIVSNLHFMLQNRYAQKAIA